MSRSPRTETKRLQLAHEAQRILEEELAAMAVPQLTLAQSRAAGRLKIATRTLRRRLADVPVASTPEDIGAALAKLAGSGPSGTRGLDKIVAVLERHLDPSRLTIIDGGEY
jgi:hypothetical protein